MHGSLKKAANRLYEELKDQFSSIDWNKIRGFRNRIVNDYMGIDYQVVWLIKESFLPLLKDQINIILNA